MTSNTNTPNISITPLCYLDPPYDDENQHVFVNSSLTDDENLDIYNFLMDTEITKETETETDISDKVVTLESLTASLINDTKRISEVELTDVNERLYDIECMVESLERIKTALINDTKRISEVDLTSVNERLYHLERMVESLGDDIKRRGVAYDMIWGMASVTVLVTGGFSVLTLCVQYLNSFTKQ
jgi:hypothetical protein